MMIRINLLPREEIPHRRGLHLPRLGQLAPAAVVLLMLAGMTALGVYQSRTVSDLRTSIAQAEEESRRLAPEIAKIKRLNQQRQELNQRLDIITDLDRDRYFRVHLMDEVNRALPEHMWLTRFEDLGGDVYAVEGVTFSNFLVSDLLQNLASSPYFATVDLIVVEKGEIQDVQVVKFQARTTAMRPPVERG
jgi:type IV pilus assembly protein PilN